MSGSSFPEEPIPEVEGKKKKKRLVKNDSHKDLKDKKK